MVEASLCYYPYRNCIAAGSLNSKQTCTSKVLNRAGVGCTTDCTFIRHTLNTDRTITLRMIGVNNSLKLNNSVMFVVCSVALSMV